MEKLLTFLFFSVSVLFVGYLQDLVYKLSKVGQAIENNDLEAACLVLGKGIDSGWVRTVNLAFTKVFCLLLPTHNGQIKWLYLYVKTSMLSPILSHFPQGRFFTVCWSSFFVLYWQLSSNPEKNTEVETFNSYLASLITSGSLFFLNSLYTRIKFIHLKKHNKDLTETWLRSEQER